MRTSLAPIQRLGFSERSPKRWESSLGRSSSRLLEAITCWRRSFGFRDRLPIHRAAEKGSFGNLHSYTRTPIRYRGVGKRLVSELPRSVLLVNASCTAA